MFQLHPKSKRASTLTQSDGIFDTSLLILLLLKASILLSTPGLIVQQIKKFIGM